ncbi:hypothetical protein MBRA_03414 [Methylobacterium brachiatum]|nr:hypothetical protein MBRA_03414 [Methylobacterium brachiatum]
MTDAASSPPAHGVAGWPFGPITAGPGRPAALPDGRPWPRIRVVTLADSGIDAKATAASVLRQDYAELRHDLVPPGFGRVRIETILAEPGCDALLWLHPGDLLAPGALTALALEAALTGAAAVAGLRVLFADTVLELDIPGMEAWDGVPFPGGAVLWMRGALHRHAVLDADGDLHASAAWSALPAAARSRIGRPVLLQHLNEAPAARSGGLAIVSLTGTGTQGGAGVARGGSPRRWRSLATA